MILLPLIALFGCESQPNKYGDAAKKIEEALQQKYGEAFIVEKIGGGFGTVNSNTIKSMASPKSDPSIKFQVEITKDLEKVYDKYLNEIVAQSNVKPIEEMARKFWSDAKVTITNDTVWTYPTHVDRDMTYEEFLKLYPSNTQLISVFVNGANYINEINEMNEDAELLKYQQFAKALVGSGNLKTRFNVKYLSLAAYSRYDELRRQSAEMTYEYKKEEDERSIMNFVNINGSYISENGKLEDSEDDFKETFEHWKRKRQEYSEKKGNM
ncbi:hypothetical protein [Paenibacillus sp. 1001270B_150601_E10]|uniref:hypothetical protein n=1 Tax=Paenibacillus sp. 1001270B_150601_E10 TaxID=2787079 RepID=UPI0018A003A8|nr:hypothetical protein [Paenibacillus sp. 1001270B_150601_E10]